MTPLSRFLSCLLHRPSDRVSVGNAVSIATVDLMAATGCFFPEAHLDAHTMAGLAAAGHELLGYDTIAPVYSVTQESAALGCEVNWGHPEQMPVVRGRLWRCGADIDIPAGFLHHPACAVVLDALRLLRARYPNVALIGKTFGPWTLAYHLFGIEPFLMLTLDDPPQVRDILHRLKDVAVLFASAQFDAGADAVTLGDHATGDLVSGEMYRSFLQPIHTELAERIPGPVILHICGDTADRLAAIAQTGLTCFHFDSKVPARRAREIVKKGTDTFSSSRIAGKGCLSPFSLMGNINNPQTLLRGAPEDVAREVAECLRWGIEIIAPECAVPLTTPTENLRAIAEAVGAEAKA